MPDIAMCLDGDDKCPLATTCYRSRKSGTKPSEYRQSYTPWYEHGFSEEDCACEAYWPNPYRAAQKEQG